MSQAVLSVLFELSIMFLKACKVSLVAIGAHSERRIEILTSSTLGSVKTISLTTRKFGPFSSFETCLEHCKCI